MRPLRDESGQSAGPRAGFARQQFKDCLQCDSDGRIWFTHTPSLSHTDLLDAEVRIFLLIRSRSFRRAECYADRVSK